MSYWTWLILNYIYIPSIKPPLILPIFGLVSDLLLTPSSCLFRHFWYSCWAGALHFLTLNMKYTNSTAHILIYIISGNSAAILTEYSPHCESSGLLTFFRLSNVQVGIGIILMLAIWTSTDNIHHPQTSSIGSDVFKWSGGIGKALLSVLLKM